MDVEKIKTLYQQVNGLESKQGELEKKPEPMEDRRTSNGIWIPNVGVNLLRLLPWERDPEGLPLHLKEAFTFRDDNDNPILGDDGKPIIIVPPFLPYLVHRIDGNETICSASFGDGKDCPMCANGDFARERYFSFIIPIVDEDNPLDD